MESNCTLQSITQFPSGLFTLEQRIHGALIVHVMISAYVLGMLIVISSEYFVPAVERFASVADIPSDITGTAVIATAASAPQLAVAVIGVFLAKSDIGLGAVVGSAYFSVFFILGVCVLSTTETLTVSWWPVLRDMSVFICSTLIFMFLLYDQSPNWWDGLILILAYGIYIIILIFNSTLERAVTRLFCNIQSGCIRCCKQEIECEDDNLIDESQLINNQGLTECSIQGQIFNKSQEGPVTYNSTVSTAKEEDTTKETIPDNTSSPIIINAPSEAIEEIRSASKNDVSRLAIIYILIPDFRKPRAFRYMFAVTILMSVILIGLLAYILVWMFAIIGSTIGIPDSIMGFTFLAAMASFPDLLSAVIVSRHGYGDMAMANCIGSNIFELLVCLGLPWLIKGVFISENSAMLITANIFTISISLIGSNILLLIFLCLFKWKLTRIFGVLMFASYFGLIALMIMFSELFAPHECDTTM